jgi:hypothetical protein
VRARIALAFAALAVAAIALPPRAASGDDASAFAATFRKQSADAKAEVRLKAYESAATSNVAGVVDLLIAAIGKEVERRDALAKEQVDKDKELESVLNAIEKANQTSPKTPKEIDEYNVKVTKLESRRDALNRRLKDLASETVSEAAVLSKALASLGAATAKEPPDAHVAHLDKLAAAWSGPKSDSVQRVRWVDLLGATPSEEAAKRLRATTLDDAADARERVLAIQYRFTRGDATLLADAAAILQGTSWSVLGAAIDALRRLHRKECIPPLIELLGRNDLGVLREKAHRALRSLTGEKHGPYQQPWADWWKVAEKTFEVPKEPASTPDLLKPDKGVTFFDVTSFSDRVLFVLDVSGSMLDPAHPGAPGARGEATRIDVAKKQLVGALNLLDVGDAKEKKVFNLVFFNHRVMPYEASPVVADKPSIERARQFIERLEPGGGTNIHDALETAFELANPTGAAGIKPPPPAFDTVYFLTDGTPTAGKVQAPEGILAAVAEWNRSVHVTIHVIGLGEADPAFLKTLAERNEGVFVQR